MQQQHGAFPHMSSVNYPAQCDIAGILTRADITFISANVLVKWALYYYQLWVKLIVQVCADQPL